MLLCLRSQLALQVNIDYISTPELEHEPLDTSSVTSAASMAGLLARLAASWSQASCSAA